MFKNKYGELRSGWAVLMVIALTATGYLAAGFLADDDAGPGMKIVVTLIFGCITIIGGLFLFRCLYGQTHRQLGMIFKKCAPDLLHGAVVGALSMSLIFTLLLLTGQVRVTQIDLSKLISLTIIVEIGSLSVFAFSEELLTRGLMMTAMKTTRNKYIIFIVPAFLFSLFHFLNPGVTFVSFFNTFLAGLLLAYLFIKSGKLWLPAGFHIMWNFVQGDLFGMNVSGGEAYAVFHTQIIGANRLLTGGEYGPEGGIFVTGVLVAGFIYVHFVVKPSSVPVWTVSSDLPLVRH